MAWTALPQGQSIAIRQNYWYAAVASVKNSHTSTDIQSLALKYGIVVTNLTDPAPGNSPDGSGYRLVAIMGQAQQDGGSIPWSVPSPLDLFDGSHVVQAWSAPPSASAPPVPAAYAGSTTSGGSDWWLWGGIALVGLLALREIGRRKRKAQGRCLPCEAGRRERERSEAA